MILKIKWLLFYEMLHVFQHQKVNKKQPLALLNKRWHCCDERYEPSSNEDTAYSLDQIIPALNIQKSNDAQSILRWA